MSTNEISINFTPEQYKNLLKLACLGEWMTNSYKTEDENTTFEEVQEILFRNAERFGLEELVVIDEDGSYPSALLEDDEELRETIDAYDTDNQWDGLIEMLAEKISVNHYGEEKLKELPVFTRFFAESVVEELISQEFQENGIDNLNLAVSLDLPTLEELEARVKEEIDLVPEEMQQEMLTSN